MAWLHHLWRHGAGRLSWQVRIEFYWNAVKQMRLRPIQARKIVTDLAHWTPVGTSLGLIEQAWRWVDTAQLSYWDALIVAAAERSGAEYLVSEDLQGGRVFASVMVVNPFANRPADFGL